MLFRSYGNHSVWSFSDDPTPDIPFRWRETLWHPMAEQMRHLKALRLSRPYFDFRPAPELVRDDDAYMAHQAAARGESYAFIYSPLGMPVYACAGRMNARVLRASWFDPRTGETHAFATVPGDLDRNRPALFVPPSSGKGCDWVLILDTLEPSREEDKSAFQDGDGG